MTEHDATIARYIDAKADAARRYAKRRPTDEALYLYLARVLDALADEVRMGLATGDDHDPCLPEQ